MVIAGIYINILLSGVAITPTEKKTFTNESKSCQKTNIMLYETRT